MSYNREKEFIRECFMDGSLDLGDFERLKRFCQIFSGEFEAIIALSHITWLDDEPEKMKQLVAIANPSMESVDEHARWINHVMKGTNHE